jgi:hypothetical protein
MKVYSHPIEGVSWDMAVKQGMFQPIGPVGDTFRIGQ